MDIMQAWDELLKGNDVEIKELGSLRMTALYWKHSNFYDFIKNLTYTDRWSCEWTVVKKEKVKKKVMYIVDRDGKIQNECITMMFKPGTTVTVEWEE